MAAADSQGCLYVIITAKIFPPNPLHASASILSCTTFNCPVK